MKKANRHKEEMLVLCRRTQILRLKEREKETEAASCWNLTPQRQSSSFGVAEPKPDAGFLESFSKLNQDRSLFPSTDDFTWVITPNAIIYDL